MITARGRAKRLELKDRFRVRFEAEQRARRDAHDEVQQGLIDRIIDAGLVDCDGCGKPIDECICKGAP